MKFLKHKKVKGYIEGYYGKLLTWRNRYEIINSLNKYKMNFYFYCPKEDIKHRLNWKKNYSKNWLEEFKNFCNYARKKNVEIIAGISPGIDFNFKSYLMGDKSDISIIVRKLRAFIDNKVKYVSILLDDLPNDFHKISNIADEGVVHANIINEVSSKFKVPFFAVPRIYSDELSFENKFYIKGFFKTINQEINIFYCGKYIVSNNFTTRFKIIKDTMHKNRVVFWDNFYANDYCPKKIYLGPWLNKNLINRSMINGTGLVNTDLLILKIVNETYGKKNKLSIWKKLLLNNKIPIQFYRLKKYFLSPNFSNEHSISDIQIYDDIYSDLDFLLWKWKSDLSREWYPYLLNLKQDLQLLNNELDFNRILKIQTNPFQKKIFSKEKIL